MKHGGESRHHCGVSCGGWLAGLGKFKLVIVWRPCGCGWAGGLWVELTLVIVAVELRSEEMSLTCIRTAEMMGWRASFSLDSVLDEQARHAAGTK